MGFGPNMAKIGRKEKSLVVAKQRSRPKIAMGDEAGTKCPILHPLVAT